MSGLIFRTEAIKIINKGGGYKGRTRKEIIKNALGGEHVYRHREVSAKRHKGTDYVVFNCPAPDCGKRNNKSIYEAKGKTESGDLSFICHGCRREIEVSRPSPKHEDPSIILPGIETARHVGLYGPDNRPLR
jgi:hypothetical protein